MDQIQQVISKIQEANNVLIIIGGNSGDSLAAGLALRSFLKKLEKEAMVLSYSPKLQTLDFLAGFTEIRDQINLVKSFVINVSTKKTEIEELSYKKEPEQLSIFIKPKKGSFAATDVSFRSSNFPFELLILIGVDSLEQLGEIYNQNTILFFETPMLNIGFRASNEAYAQFNLINLTATSHSEIVYDLINQFEASIIDEPIATQLLAGIIFETDSFQHVRTTPQAFLKASQLVGMGANQQEIISRLYKSKSLGMLKLWGRVLARLKQETEIGLVYSAVNQSDLGKAEASDDDAALVIKEMASQLGFARLFLFFKEEAADRTVVYFHSSMPLDLTKIFKNFSPTALDYQTIRFTLNLPASSAEKQAIELLTVELQKYKVNM